jgi:hypothetical protein
MTTSNSCSSALSFSFGPAAGQQIKKSRVSTEDKKVGNGGKRTVLEVPPVLLKVLVEVFEYRRLRLDRNRHVVLDRVETAEDEIEKGDLEGGQGQLCRGISYRRSLDRTYNTGKVTVELVDDGSEGPGGSVEESPALPHLRTVPVRVAEHQYSLDVAVQQWDGEGGSRD